MPLYYLDCSMCRKVSTYQSYEEPLSRCRWCDALFRADAERGMVLSPPTFGPVWYACPLCGAKALSGYNMCVVCLSCGSRMAPDVGSVFDDIKEVNQLITDLQQFLKIGSAG
jgi:hypothetical protein